MAKIAVAICVHYDYWFLEETIRSFGSEWPVTVFVSRLPWFAQEPGDWEECVRVAERCGAEVVIGNWPCEILQRQGALLLLIERGITHVFVPAADEVLDRSLFSACREIARFGLGQRVYAEPLAAPRSPGIPVEPIPNYPQTIFLEAAGVYPNDISPLDGRLFVGGRGLIIGREFGYVHQRTFLGPDDRIRRKIETWTRLGVLPGWLRA